MSNARRKIVVFLLSLMCVVTMGFALAACTDAPGKDQNKGELGPESGMYYYDADSGETYYLTLTDADRATLQIDGTLLTGGYTLTDGAFTMTADEGDTRITGTYSDGVLSVTYEERQMRFLRAENYTLTFETNGGGTLPEAHILNGRTAQKPADPVREGYVFLGWFADAQYSQPFTFGQTPVTQNMTLYARWSDETAGGAVYTVDFDLGYDAEAPAAMQTAGGKLYGVPEPAREGYAFRGWWISDYESADRLTRLYEEDTVFGANTTLFALWQEEGTGRLDTPAPRVEGDSVVWDPVTGVSTYSVEIVGPNDNTVYDRSTGATSVSVPFSEYAEGDYVIRVQAMGMTGGEDSETAVRYLSNKALERVSLFSVAEPSILTYNGVEGAERYTISIECGNPAHEHAALDNGTSTWFDFSGCTMKEGGIAFTVTASAAGRASSVSEVFTFDRSLDRVGAFYFEEDTETLAWDAVAAAADYAVTVSDGEKDVSFTTGGRTSVSLAGYAGTRLTVRVTPETEGYNSPAAGEYIYERARLAAPSDLVIKNAQLTWSAVAGAQSYTVLIDGREFSVREGAFSFHDAGLANGIDYTVSVKSVGASESVWSDPIAFRYYSLSPALTYRSGVVSWHPVVGALSYEVRVNGGTAVTVPTGTTSCAVTLTQRGGNAVSVRFTDDAGTLSDWVTLDVYAYEISFDTREGGAVNSLYLANGDVLHLPEAVRAGFTLGGWYTVPGAAGVNGQLVADGTTLSTAGDVVLYAGWTPNSYTVTYDMTQDGGTVDKTQDTVVYTEDFRLAVPVNSDTSLSFVGWYSAPNGVGEQYTDAEGKGLAPWSEIVNTTVYPRWITVLSFELQEEGEYEGTYAVTAAAGVSAISRLVIPETYNDLPVTIIEGYAFNRSSTLRVIEIPDTIELVYYDSAFEGCSALEEVNVYETGRAVSPAYSSHEGVLYYTSEVALEGKELVYLPEGRTGHYTIPDDVQSIGQNALSVCRLESVTIPASVSNIAVNAFADNAYITALYFDYGDGDELIIGEGAFSGCTSLKDIDIPVRFTDFDPAIFGDSTSLENISVAEGHEKYSSVDGMLADAAGTTLVYCPSARRGSVRIPVGITKVAASAFANCVSVTQIVIPNFVTEIEAGAFIDCARLTSVVFAGGNALGSPMAVGAQVFAGCSELVNVVFEENSNVVSLGEYVFDGCIKLTTVNLPATVASLSEGVFTGCENLVNVNVDEDSMHFASQGGVLFDKAMTRLMYYSENLTQEEYVLPETVRTIDAHAFNGNASLKKVILGNRLESIGAYAFAECAGLADVVFVEGGSAALNIGEGAFEDCSSLVGLYSAASADASEESYEYGMSARLRSIGEAAFSGTNLSVLVLPEGLTEIGASAFSGLGIAELELPASLVTIGEDAFFNCSALAALTVAENSRLESIGAYAFSGCAFASFEVPASVTYIGDRAFASSDADLFTLTFAEGREEGIYLGTCLFSGTRIESVTFPDNVSGFYVMQNGFLYTTLDYATGLKEVFNVPAHNVYEYDGGVIYEKEDGVRVTVNHVVMTEVNYVIPNTVTLIMNGAFSDSDGCTVTFEEGGTEDLVVEAGAFLSAGVERVAFPARLASLGEDSADGYGAFGSSQVLEVTFEAPSRLTAIPAGAFAGATELNAIEIPASVKSIGELAFSPRWSGTMSLSEVTLHEGLESIGAYAFADDTGNGTLLTEVGIPSTVTMIGSYAFGGSQKLESVTFAEGSELEVLGSSAFRNTAIRSVTLPATLAGSAYGSDETPNGQLASRLFQGCSRLQEVIFEDGCPLLTTYGDYVFSGCTNYSYIEFPVNLTAIGTWGTAGGAIKSIEIPAFFDVETFMSFAPSLTGVEEFSIAADNPYLKQHVAEDGTPGAVYDNTFTTLLYYPACYTAESYTLHENTVSIGANAFFENRHLKTVTLPEGVETIGSLAFGVSDTTLSTALEKINIPSTVKTIGDGAFYGADRLTTVTFDKNAQGSWALETVGDWAFRECTALKSIALPDSITSLGVTSQPSMEHDPDASGSVFYGCTSLESVTLPNNLTDLQSYTFGNCPALKSISFNEGSNLQRIAAYAFAGSGLTALDLTKAERIYVIEDRAFYNCPIATLVFGEKGEFTIGSEVFVGAQIASLELPAELTSIGESAFEGIEKLTSLTVAEGSKLTYIGAGAFRGTGISAVPFASMTQLTYIGDYAFAETSLAGAIALPDGVEEIGAYAFSGCSGVTSLTLPAQLVSIGDYAFAGLAVEEIVIPGNETVVGDGAFEGCAQLASVTLSEGVVSLGTLAFAFTSLTQVTLPETLTSFSGNPFAGCALTSITFSADHTGFVFDGAEGTLFNSDGSLLYYVTPTTATLTVVDSSVTAIMPGAFAGTDVVEVSLPSNIGEIPKDAFKNCTSLTTVVIGKNVTEIGASAFEGCTNLSSLTFEQGGTQGLTIGDRAFYGCTSLTALELPDRLRDYEEYFVEEIEIMPGLVIPIETLIGMRPAIGVSAFEGSGLVTVTYEDDVPAGISTDAYDGFSMMVSARAFYGCEDLVSVKFGGQLGGNSNWDFVEGQMCIGDYAFYGCTKLAAVELVPVPEADGTESGEEQPYPEMFRSSALGVHAFDGCTSLTSFTIPIGLEYLAPYCFANTGLKSLYLPDMTDPIMADFGIITAVYVGEYAFADCKDLETVVSDAYLDFASGNYDRAGYESGSGLGAYAFAGCTSLTSATFSRVVDLCEGTFDGCTSLQTVSIAFGETNYEADYVMEAYAFRGCSSLTSLTLTGVLSTVGSQAFAGCSALKQVTLPENVVTVAADAFLGWTAAQTIEVPYDEGFLPASYMTGWSAGATVRYADSAAEDVPAEEGA